MKKEDHPRCAYDLCNRKLFDIAWVSKSTGEMFCDEMCGERQAIEREPSPLRVQ